MPTDPTRDQQKDSEVRRRDTIHSLVIESKLKYLLHYQVSDEETEERGSRGRGGRGRGGRGRGGRGRGGRGRRGRGRDGSLLTKPVQREEARDPTNDQEKDSEVRGRGTIHSLVI